MTSFTLFLFNLLYFSILANLEYQVMSINHKDCDKWVKIFRKLNLMNENNQKIITIKSSEVAIKLLDQVDASMNHYIDDEICHKELYAIKVPLQAFFHKLKLDVM